MKRHLFRYSSVICIVILAILEIIVWLLPEMMAGPLSYVLLFAFVITMACIQLHSFHHHLNKKNKGGYSL